MKICGAFLIVVRKIITLELSNVPRHSHAHLSIKSRTIFGDIVLVLMSKVVIPQPQILNAMGIAL